MPTGGINPDAYGSVPTGTAGTLTTDQLATVPVAMAGAGAASALSGNLAPYIGAGLSAAASIWGQARANKANRELAEYQNQWNLEQWQRQMEYNLPKNQMQRLRDAGINPHMAYAKGTINNVTNQRPTAAKAADQKSVIPNMSLAQLMLQMKMQEAQINNLNAQTANTNQSTQNLAQGKKSMQYETLNKTIAALQDYRYKKQLKTNMQNSNLNTSAQRDILEIQYLMENKKWEQFRDHNILNSDNYYIRKFGDEVSSLLGKGDSLETVTNEVKGQIINLWTDLLHVLKLGVGINTLDNK